MPLISKNTGALAAAILVMAMGIARADEVWIGQSGTNPIPAPGVTIINIEAGNLVYRTPGGTQLEKPLSQMQQISVDGNDDFNGAEKSFVSGNWAAAISGYQTVLNGSPTQWISERSAMRMAQAASKAGRFDAAITAYATILQSDPKLAATVKPQVPAEGSSQLKPAEDALNSALGAASLSSSQRSSLLGLQLQVERKLGENAAVTSTLQQMMQLGTIDPADRAIVKLASARMAIDNKNFTQANTDIEQNQAIFTEPSQQVDALYLLALAHEGNLSGDSTSNDIKDTAINFMKVVAYGKNLPNHPHVADALLHTAQLEEKLKEPKVAIQVYKQVSKQYPSSPAAAAAKSAIDRLGKSTP